MQSASTVNVMWIDSDGCLKICKKLLAMYSMPPPIPGVRQTWECFLKHRYCCLHIKLCVMSNCQQKTLLKTNKISKDVSLYCFFWRTTMTKFMTLTLSDIVFVHFCPLIDRLKETVISYQVRTWSVRCVDIIRNYISTSCKWFTVNIITTNRNTLMAKSGWPFVYS